jgi:hypothetical protein
MLVDEEFQLVNVDRALLTYGLSFLFWRWCAQINR